MGWLGKHAEDVGHAGAEPDHELVRLAAEEAGVTAVIAAPETLAVGCRQHRFIQGNILTNSETFVDTPQGLWPEQTFGIWGENSGRKANAEDAPNSVLQSCWNHADRLIELAIRHHQSGRPIYPELLITPVSSKLKMGGSSKMELTHPVMVASSAGTLRRCVKHIAEGGRSERDLRDERGGPFNPGNCPGSGHIPQHGAPVPEIP